MTDVLAGGPHPAHSTVNGSPFPPIAEYGFLSDCEVCALVAPGGAHSGRQLGNFPQAFSHLALINAVMHLIREDERRRGGALPAGFDLHAGTMVGPDQMAGRGQ